MPTDLVGFSVKDGIGTIVLENPPANCYSYELMRALDERILEARRRDDVHALVLTGAGDRFFCAGADIGTLRGMTPSEKYAFCLHANETLLRLENTPKVVVAALNGHTVGGGLEVALACDIRIGRAGKFQVGLPEVKLGVLPGTGGTQRLVRLLGRARAFELMASGRMLDMQAAQAEGLLHRVITGDDVEEFRAQVRDYAAGFVPPAGASKAVGLIKRALLGGADGALADGLALERELQQQLFLSDDAKEGLVANREKRDPRFQGR